MVAPELVTGVTVPVLTSWLADQLPRPGLPLSENERRIRNIVLAMIVGFGVGYIAKELTGRLSTQTKSITTGKKITVPGYYE